MPLKVAKNSAQQDIAELRRQVTALAKDNTDLFAAVNDLGEMFEALKEQMKESSEAIMARLQDTQDMILQSTKNQLSAGTSSLITTPPNLNQSTTTADVPGRSSFIDNLIPAPKRRKIARGSRSQGEVRIKKEHIISHFIKRAPYDDLSDERAEGVYNSLKGMRKIVLELLAERLGVTFGDDENEDDFLTGDDGDEEVHITWGRINEQAKTAAIKMFEEAITDQTELKPMYCENHWVADHMLSESWANKKLRRAKVNHDREQVNNSVPPEPVNDNTPPRLVEGGERIESYLDFLAGGQGTGMEPTIRVRK